MTDETKKLREHMSMKAFTFYLDDITKLAVLQKLKTNGLDTAKGTLAALIRVLLQDFSELDPTSAHFQELINRVAEEYLFTTKKNKRSTM